MNNVLASRRMNICVVRLISLSRAGCNLVSELLPLQAKSVYQGMTSGDRCAWPRASTVALRLRRSAPLRVPRQLRNGEGCQTHVIREPS